MSKSDENASKDLAICEKCDHIHNLTKECSKKFCSENNMDIDISHVSAKKTKKKSQCATISHISE